MKTIYKKLKKVQQKLGELDSAFDDARDQIVKHFDFDFDENNGDYESYSFYVEHQASDGIILADNYSNVYALSKLLIYIEEKGSIKSYKELQQFSI